MVFYIQIQLLYAINWILKIFHLINENINNFNIPISVITTTGSIHDSKILNN